STDALPYEALAAAVRDHGIDAARALVGAQHAAPVHTRAASVHPVLLVGAGPGDSALLTLGAAEALRHAEVVLYDRLASQAVLEMVPPECVRVPVEKRG